MVKRSFWLAKIEAVWKKVPIVWLSGVRRVGKTTLCKEFEGEVEYLNCDLETVRERLSSIELFYKSVDKKIIIFDEIHQLRDPSLVLKIGADEFGHLKILATGSSTLAATKKFSDSLTGRKRAIHLVPVLWKELEAFGVKDIRKRLLRGGLPPALLSKELDEDFYREWMDSYFARDVQELFNVGKRHGFLKLFELLIRENGSMLEVTRLANVAGISVPTVYNYISVLEVTHAIRVLRPFHDGGKKEVVKQPKCYAFDTGFVSFFNGWSELSNEQCGHLWENLVLESMEAMSTVHKINYWRDQNKHEIDFVCARRDGSVDAIECKWNPKKFDPKGLNVFRKSYPEGRNIVVSAQVDKAYVDEVQGHEVVFCSLDDLEEKLG